MRRQNAEKEEAGRQLENVIKPLVDETTDIIKNHPEKIKKTRYDGKEHIAGVLLDNGTTVVVHFNYNFSVASVFINRIFVPFYKVNNNIRNDNDPLGEDDWNEDEISPTKILGDLVMDHIKHNEVIW